MSQAQNPPLKEILRPKSEQTVYTIRGRPMEADQIERPAEGEERRRKTHVGALRRDSPLAIPS
jgi:hypothetical protein